jgi:DNA-binding phage protein
MRNALGSPALLKSTTCRRTSVAIGTTEHHRVTHSPRIECLSEHQILARRFAATLFLNGDPETARLIVRDLVNATVGFEKLAKLTDTPSRSLHRMLSPKGNPSMDNLAAIFGAVGTRLKVDLKVRAVRAQ